MFKIFPINAYRFLFKENKSDITIETDLADTMKRIRRGDAVLDEFFTVSEFFDYYSQHQHSTAVLEMALANWNNDSIKFRLAMNYLREQRFKNALTVLFDIGKPDLLDHILIAIAQMELNNISEARSIFKSYAGDPDFIAELNSFDRTVLSESTKSRMFNELESFQPSI